MPVAALVLFAAFLLICGWVRPVIQWHRTGDTGDRRRASRGVPGQRWVDALGAVGSLCAGVAGPIAALAGLRPLAVLDRPPVHAAGLALAAAGLAAAFAAQLAMGASWRVGVDPGERTALVTSGVFGIVRNPILACALVMFTGLALMTANLVALAGPVALLAGVELQVRVVEEPHLLRTHGDRYRECASRVGRFLPLVGRWR